MKILIASKNPVKIDATKEAFSHYFEDIEILSFDVSSGIPDQPIDNETFEGAKNRALELQKINKEKNLEGDFFVGIEGGIQKLYDIWFSFSVTCIIDKEDTIGFGTSPNFELPEFIIKKLLDRIELGDVMQDLTKVENIKQKGGAISFFSKGKIDRKSLYVPGIMVALIHFLNKELFSKNC